MGVFWVYWGSSRVVQELTMAPRSKQNEKDVGNVVVLGWAQWSHYKTVYSCYANPRRKEIVIPHCKFECFLKLFIRETMLFAISREPTVFRRCPKEYAPSGPSEKFRNKRISEWWMKQARKFMELSPMRRPSTMDEVGERINLTDTEAATQMWISRLPPSFKR